MHVAGAPIAFAAETDVVASNIDHFWITIRIAEGEVLQIALSTRSRQNAAAGFDPRIRIGVISSGWNELPLPGIIISKGLDYRQIEAGVGSPITFVEYERPDAEALLMDKGSRATFIEAWGELYFRNQLGIHQVHSRRASCSVPQDHIGRDGAIRFYFEKDAPAEMLLFKFCGQP